MPIRFKINVLQALKAAGWNTGRLRKERMLAESTIQQLREGKMVSYLNLGRICKLLGCQPGDIIEYDHDADDEENAFWRGFNADRP